MGVIINRPLDKHVSELLTDPAPGALADVPVFLGGPVGTNQLMFAAFDWAGRNSLSLNQNVAIEEANQLAFSRARRPFFELASRTVQCEKLWEYDHRHSQRN